MSGAGYSRALLVRRLGVRFWKVATFGDARDRFWSDDGQSGMYGPPPSRKRKVRVTGWSAQMYTVFVGVDYS
jgi:hypothetical protein